MKKINNKGFMMAELLAVTVVVLVIFTILFTNYVPLKGEYEKRLDYNDIDSLYTNYYMRVFLLKYFNNNGSKVYPTLTNGSLVIVQDSVCKENYSYGDFDCQTLVTSLDIKDVVITNYNPGSNYSGLLSDYINYLDIYSDSNNYYRITTKTSTGYSSDKFYSMVCDSYIYTSWSSYSITSCSGDADVCEKANKNVKSYNNGTAKPINCDENPLCYKNGDNYIIITYPCTTDCNDKIQLYRTREKIKPSSSDDNFSISPCS